MQSKRQSFIETAVSLVVGLGISFIIQITLYPLMGIPVTMGQNVFITFVFFTASFLRAYILRRIFNNLHSKDASKEDGTDIGDDYPRIHKRESNN